MVVRVNMVNGGVRGVARYAHQGGQAMVFTTLFAGAAALAALMLYNTGMLANTRTQLQNAADAAAYSAALMLARDHNFSAYANRAMVANQVAVAQLVSMKAYLEDAADTHNRLSGVVQSIEALAPISKPLWDFGKKVPIEAANNAYSDIAGPAVKALDTLIRAYDTAQTLHHDATAANVLFVANEVVKKNDPKASVTTGAFNVGNTVLQLKKWNLDYTKKYSANDASKEADRFADVVVDDKSTDLFTRNRTSVPVPAWSSIPNPLACPLMVPVNTTFAFVHGGGTILSGDKRRWLSLDATMGGGAIVCEIITPLGPVTEVTPLVDPSVPITGGLGGSGGASAGNGSGYGETNGYKSNPFVTKEYGWSLVDPATAVPAWVRYAKGPGTSLDTNGGLQDYYRDMADLATQPANQSPELNGGAFPLTIEVEHKQDDVRTSSQVIGTAAANIKLEPQMKGTTMRALASAHAYFYRANQDSSAFTRGGWKRDDGKTEIANLFNPYWQARLIDRTEAERALSVASQ